MRFIIVDKFTIDGGEELEDHKERIDKALSRYNPEYYAVETDLIRSLWKSEITILAPVE